MPLPGIGINPDLVLMDIQLAGTLDGIETAEWIHIHLGIPVIFLTAHADDANLERAKVTEPYGYLVKPYDERELHSIIEMALYKHRMEEKDRESGRTIRALANAMPDAVLLLDAKQRIIALNESMARRLGQSPAALIGADIYTHIPRDLPPRIRELLVETIQQCRTMRYEESRGERWFEVAIFPITGQGCAISRIMIQYHDITDLKLIEQQIREQGIARIDMNMEQFQILNDEIRNPLQIILGGLQIDCRKYKPKIEEQVSASTTSSPVSITGGWNRKKSGASSISTIAPACRMKRIRKRPLPGRSKLLPASFISIMIPSSLISSPVILTPQGFTVYSAEGGEKGIGLLGTIAPDLVLLDLMMEPMDGWATLLEIRNNPRTREVPVMMVTAKPPTLEEIRKYGGEIGDFLMKPMDLQQIAASVRQAIETNARMARVVEGLKDHGTDPGRIREYISLQRKVRIAQKLFRAFPWPPEHRYLLPAPDGVPARTGWHRNWVLRPLLQHVNRIREGDNPCKPGARDTAAPAWQQKDKNFQEKRESER